MAREGCGAQSMWKNDSQQFERGLRIVSRKMAFMYFPARRAHISYSALAT